MAWWLFFLCATKVGHSHGQVYHFKDLKEDSLGIAYSPMTYRLIYEEPALSVGTLFVWGVKPLHKLGG